VAEDEITVCIGRYGDLLFSDGAHRLAIAKILNLPRVPIKVAVRHRDWITFRDELLQYYNHSQGSMVEKVIQPVTHIDFLDVPFSEDFEASFRIIADNTSVKTGRLLDLASGFGYFCHRFEEYGFDCVAVENDPQAANILKRLARAGNRKFMIIDQSLVENTYLFDRHFNIVLAIDIIPHLKTEHTFKRLIDFFRTLHMDELFLGVPLRELTHLQGINQGLSPAELVSIILGNSSLNTAKIIGTTIGNKPLFKLYSQAH
jgi:SAM-dependent methyltransferase